jgi:hypothetical protein
MAKEKKHEKDLIKDQETFEQSSPKLKEVEILRDRAEKSIGKERSRLDKKIRKRAGLKKSRSRFTGSQ